MPTFLSSAELFGLDANIRERSLFSAKNACSAALDTIAAGIDGILNPETKIDPATGQPYTAGINPATARADLKELYAQIGYTAPTGKEGTIEDFSSDQRIDLVLHTNVQMAQGYGQWRQGQDPGAVDAYPAQEMVRLEDRTEPREWIQRWRAGGGQVYSGSNPGPLPLVPGPDGSNLRLIATKDSSVWTAISRFGTPYPPFDFNSGVWTWDVDLETCVRLGVLKQGQRLLPQFRPFEMILG